MARSPANRPSTLHSTIGESPAVRGCQTPGLVASHRSEDRTSSHDSSSRCISAISTPTLDSRSSRSPAWLSLILVVLAALVKPAVPQSLHFYFQKTDMLTGNTRIVNMQGGLNAGSTGTIYYAIDLVSTGVYGNIPSCQIKVYRPTFTNSSTAGYSFSVYCSKSVILFLQPDYTTVKDLVALNRQTRKIAFITGTSSPYTLSVPTEDALSFTGALSSVSVPMTSANFEMMVDMEGTSSLLLLARGSTLKGVIADLSGATPTITPISSFPGSMGFDSTLGASTCFSKSLLVLNGATSTFSGGTYTVTTFIYLYDVYTSLGNPILKASYSSSRYAPGILLVDNLNNQDYIYTMLLDIIDQNNPISYMAVIKIPSFIAAQSGTTFQTGDIWIPANDACKNPIASSLVYTALLNAGTVNYVIALLPSADVAVQFYPKSATTFGSTFIFVRMPPNDPLTSATYAYGFFSYFAGDSSSLYYQPADYTKPIYKAPMVVCPPATLYFNVVDFSCTDGSALPSGFRKDTTYFEIEPCTIAHCDTCPDFASVCTLCKATYSLYLNTCPLCTIADCVTCDTDNHCKTCAVGYLPDASGLCTVCDSANGYSWNTTLSRCQKTCTVAQCIQCLRTNGGSCSTCAVGYLGTACSTCDAGNGYSPVGPLCVLQCPSVSHCTTCATTTTCLTCNAGYTGATCSTCDTGSGYAPDGPLCVLQCPSVSHCDVCATISTCQTCSTGYAGSLCTSCAANYAMVSGSCVLQCPSVAHCDVCATPTTCTTCAMGYSGTLCDTCTANYLKIGADCVLQCPSVSHCTTCATTTTCLTCNAGYTGATCSTCDTGSGYAPDGPLCVLQCPSVSHCDVCATISTCQTCSTGYAGSLCTSCAANYAMVSGSCVLQCPSVAHCDVCATPTTCTTCATGYSGSLCDTCTANYLKIGADCVLQCPTVSHCDVCATTTTCQTCSSGYMGPTCSTCDGVNGYAPIGPNCVLQCPLVTNCDVCQTQTSCKTCSPNYGLVGIGCVLQCPTVSHCDVCATPTTCQTCATGYVGTLCDSCDTNYAKKGSLCVLQCPSVSRCSVCATPLSCQTCETGYSGPSCNRCAPGYLADPANPTACVACNIASCTECSTANVCSKCSGSMVPVKSGTQCIALEDSCKSSIPKCQTCSSETKCQTCQTSYYLSDDKSQCKVKTCSVASCLECDSETVCTKCKPGRLREKNGTLCSLLSEPSKDQVYSVYSPEHQTGFVQLNRAASDFDVKAFTFTLRDTLSDSTFECPLCSAELDAEFAKALVFRIRTDVELLSASLHSTFAVSTLKSSSRSLESTTEEESVLIVENLRLPGNGSNNDEMTHNAFIAFNAIRLLGMLVLGFFSSVHAFWPTIQFSWLQVWAVLPGRFLSYPDRFLNWHYKWYLLVIDFGDPFKTFRDWNLDGTKCVATERYPFSKLGCSFVDNFGQNFVIIFCVLAFCLIAMASNMFYQKQKNAQSMRAVSRSNTFQGPVRTTLKDHILQNNGLGLTYFMKFMNSIQPSLMFFSLLQFNTYVNSPHMGVSVLFAVAFFIYYLASAGCCFLLSRKIWVFIKDRKSNLNSLEELAFAEGGILKSFSFQYSGYLIGTYYWQLLGPLVEFFRILLISILIIVLKKSPSAALGLVLAIEVMRTAYIAALHKLRPSLIYSVQDYVVSGLFLLYIILKLGANGSSDEAEVQLKIGWVMAAIYAAVWVSVVINIFLDGLMTKRALDKKSAELKQAYNANASPMNTLQNLHVIDKDTGEIVQMVSPITNPSNPTSRQDALVVLDEDIVVEGNGNKDPAKDPNGPKWSSLPPIKLTKMGTGKPKVLGSTESFEKVDSLGITHQTNVVHVASTAKELPANTSLRRKPIGPKEESEKEHDFDVFLKDTNPGIATPNIPNKALDTEASKPKWDSLPKLAPLNRWGNSSSNKPTTLENLQNVDRDDIIVLDKEPVIGTTFQRLGTLKLTEEPKNLTSPIRVVESVERFYRPVDEDDDDIKVDRSSLPSLISPKKSHDSLPSLALKKRTFSKPKVTEVQKIEDKDVIYLDGRAREDPVMEKPVERIDKDVIDIITQFRIEKETQMMQLKNSSLNRFPIIRDSTNNLPTKGTQPQ